MAINPYVPATATGNGVQVDFSFTFPYLNQLHVKASINGTLTTAFTFFSVNVLRFSVAPAAGAVVLIFRETPADSLSAVIQPGGPLPVDGLNRNFLQGLYYTQEAPTQAYIDAADALKVSKSGDSMSGSLAMGGNRITSLGTPSSGTDAANKTYVDDNTVFYSGSPAFIQDGAGAVTRSWSSKLKDIVNVKDFGAIGNAVFNNSSAFLAAATAVGANGTVVVPPGLYLLNTNVTAPNVQWEVYGFLFGAGKITGNESQILTYFPSQYTIPSVFSSFKAATQINCTETAQHIGDARSNLAVKREVIGSGGFGPGFSDNALFAEVAKTNWLTSSAVGEVNGIWSVVRQGSSSDSGGILIDTRKVTGGDGGTLAIESNSEWVNSSGVRQTGIETVLGFLEGAGGWSGNTGYGLYLEARAGVPYSAISALGYNDGGSNSPGAWQNLITLHSERVSNGGVLAYKVDGNGRTYAPSGTFLLPSYSFHEDPDTGIYRLGVNAFGFTTGGQVRWWITPTGTFIPGAASSYNLGDGTNRLAAVFSNAYSLGSTGLTISSGTGAPGVAAPSGSIYLRTDGGAGTTLYVSEGASWASK
jgi:hypothetical protein